MDGSSFAQLGGKVIGLFVFIKDKSNVTNQNISTILEFVRVVLGTKKYRVKSKRQTDDLNSKIVVKKERTGLPG